MSWYQFMFIKLFGFVLKIQLMLCWTRWYNLQMMMDLKNDVER